MENKEKNMAVETAEKLIRILKDHGITFEPRIYEIRGQKPEELKMLLDVEGIPYRELKTRHRILIPAEAQEDCHRISMEHLSKGSFLQEYPPGKLQKTVLSTVRIQNREAVSITGMTGSDISLFLRKCSKIKEGLLIETGESAPGRFTVTFPSALLSPEERRKVIQAYTETIMHQSGYNAGIKKNDVDFMTKDRFWSAVHEKRLAKKMYQMINEKICENGTYISDFGAYFSTYRRQFAHAMELLEKGESLSTFSKEAADQVVTAYHAVPDNTYTYTADIVRSFTVSAKDMAAVTVDRSEAAPVPERREVTK